MTTKNLLKWSLCVFQVLLFMVLSSATSAAQGSSPVELKAVSFLPAMSATVKQFKQFADKVGEASKGQLRITYLGGPEVVPAFEQGQAVSRGIVDMLLITPSLMEGMVPEGVFTLASRIAPEDEIKRGVFEKLQPFYAKANIFCLGRMAFLSKPIFLTCTTKKVDKPDDLKGVKFGGTGPMTKPIADALGADLKVIPLGDAITGLERKYVNGWIAPASGIVPFGIHEQLGYAVDHPFFPMPNVILVNLKKWNDLAGELRDVLIKTHKEMGPILGTAAEEDEANAQKVMQKAGVKFIKFSTSDAERYLDTIYDAMWANWKKVLPQTAPEFEKLLKP